MNTVVRFLPPLMLLVSLGAGAIAPMDFDGPEQRKRFKALIEELRCLVCQNQNLADSDAPLAQDLRREVLRLMNEGRTDAEIRDYLVQRYGDFVLYDPPVKPATWLLWFGPGLLLVAGATGLAVAIRRRAATSNESDDGNNE